eukprot:CAMPEP_0172305220 /NCGR_PEP_ID=MMETSP1058-20130122/6552_1 /TAXON_ID=83371 /ORGANISM="Detonula confervacea, Strain CCMP 353" /LENGTH=228 /DNA_ID=CAMNT_0013016749 /DNA_START=93 /DNA_END=779 /DNA_ORIENTATION=-
MKTFSKAVFIMLALAASASASSIASKSDEEPASSTSSKSSKKPTRKPTGSRSSSSSKSTKKPTRKPTNRSSSSSSKSTKKPTRKPTGRRPTSECVDDDSPRPVRNGVRYRFKLQKSNAQCVDTRDNLYEYGQFDKIREFSDCADACVEDVHPHLLDFFRGYDWDCKNQKCRCLYDKGTLDSRNSARFDRTNRVERGRGPIEGTTKKDSYYCARLSGTEFLDAETVETE